MLYRDTLTKTNIIRELFGLFHAQLEEAGLITHTGTIVDPTFVEVPRQHNHHDENEDINHGKTPVEWKKQENIHKLHRKDMDAR